MARVTRTIDRITIFRDHIYAGVGKLERGSVSTYIVDCDAQLGGDYDASEETYELIEAAINAGDKSVERPDGVYTWVIEAVDG